MRVPGIVALLCMAALSCCSLGEPEPPAVEIPSPPDPAELRLVEAAERAERALASLARALPAPDGGMPWHPASAMPPLESVPAKLRRPVTLDWTGPLEGLAQALAERAGYRFFAAGRRPARPLIVVVEAEEQPLIAMLRDAGLQAGDAATLTVDAASETVLLDWTLVPATAPVPSRTSGEDG